MNQRMIVPMLGEAWHAIGANRLRAFLTMLGMMIGVGAVVLMLAVGQGASAAVKKQIEAMGSHLFVVLAGSQQAGGVRTGGGNATTLTSDDAYAIRELPGVTAGAPVVIGNYQLVFESNNWNTQVFGTTPDYMTARDWKIADGSSFDDGDVQAARRVAILGKTTAQNLFGDSSPVGQTLRIKNAPFTVVGVLAPKGQSLDGRDQDDTVIVPLTTAMRNLTGSRFRNAVRMIMVQAESDAAMNSVESGMKDLLRERHRLTNGQDDDFFVNNLTAVANSAAETAKTMSLLLGAIASVSLLVGGIGIMNIMLVSVTERTREIGIRMAIGARQKDVMAQFLMEALMLSLTGGLIGVAMGAGGAFAVQAIWQTAVQVTTQSIILAFAVSAAIGLFFGFYPAWKAARLDPIEALRYQ
ncbi:putative ABC transport system permease protein [Andreprevotia lacus DSM 23236]|jgi:putative ABC transport system permease protein|uniref:Putative ABC transport system permease protein n=1 Tax=Andreprevotia lacus DSM 23236 TaxID=1121001 RepID=A0A1W1X9R5_9NEIS|nr:ABC transporter permease [Andreprevotia lacus]SMC20603.1 putative ABC transport system permease protein [Andreprevotia lacus DSM 23236]